MAVRGERESRDVGRLLVVASLVLAVAAASFALFGPTGTEEAATAPAVLEGEGEATSSPVVVERRWTSTWDQIRLGEEDAFVLWVLTAPVLVALTALALDVTRVHRVSRGVAAVLLLAFAVVSAASVGLFFLPGAVAMLAAALVPAGRAPPARRRDPRAEPPE